MFSFGESELLVKPDDLGTLNENKPIGTGAYSR